MQISPCTRTLLLAVLLFCSLLAPLHGGRRLASAAPNSQSCALEARLVETPPAMALEDIAPADDRSLWAVGSGIWRVTDGVWSEMPNIDRRNYFRGLTVLTNGEAWAVGATAGSGDPIAWHLNGATWELVALPAMQFAPLANVPTGLYSVSGSGPNNVWAAGSGILHWDGTAWSVSTLDLPADSRVSFSSIVAPHPNDAWAAGVLIDSSGHNQTLLLRWDGQSWRRVEETLPGGFSPTLLAFVPGLNVLWAAGNGSAQWDGRQWSLISLPNGSFLRRITMTIRGDSWAIGGPLSTGQANTLFRWDGRSWQRLAGNTSSDPNNNFSGIAVLAPDDVWAVGATVPRDGTSPNPLAAHVLAPCSLPTAPVGDPLDASIRYFEPTGHTIRGAFRAYWEKNGGLAQFGYPLTEPFQERSAADGKLYTVQYFERNRFELHPENAGTPYEVLLGLLGRSRSARFAATVAPFSPIAAPPTGATYFPQTGHTLAPEFAAYWREHGGLAVYGFPVSEPYQERSASDGKTYLVQYFERNRLEYHPELPSEFRVSLGLLGADTLKARGWII